MPSRLLFIALIAATACGDKDDGEDTGDGGSGAWSPYCEQTETDLAFDEVTPLGFAAADLVVGIGEPAPAVLTWASGGTTPFQLSMGWSSDAVFVDQEEATPPDDATAILELAVICEDYLRIGATLGLVTEDDALDDIVNVDLLAYTAERVDFWQDLSESDFSDPSIFDPHRVADATEQGPSLSGWFATGGNAAGELSWNSQGEDGEVAWAGTDLVASWEADGE